MRGLLWPQILDSRYFILALPENEAIISFLLMFIYIISLQKQFSNYFIVKGKKLSGENDRRKIFTWILCVTLYYYTPCSFDTMVPVLLYPQW